MNNNQVMKDKQLKMRVSDNFSLPYCPDAKVVLIIENKNSSVIDFTIDTNSPLTLKIEPATGCINVGEEVVFLLCSVPENRQNEKEHDTRMVNFRPRTPPSLEKFLDPSFRIMIGTAENHEMSAHIMTDASPCLKIGSRQSRSYACADVLHMCTYSFAEKSMKDNSSYHITLVHLPIDQVRISVSRPKTLLATQINEHLTFKVKYCCHKKSENSRNTHFSQNGNEQTYTIHNKITRGNHQSKKNPCGCTICNYAFNNEPFHHTYDNSKTLDSLISDKKKINKPQSDPKTQRKRRHSFTIYEPFVGEPSNRRENIEKCLATRTQHHSPLKHTPGDNWNVSAIKKYIQDLKIKKALLKQDNDDSGNVNSSSRYSSSERSLSIEQDMKITNQVENSEIRSRHTNCDRDNDEKNNDINFQEHLVYIHPMSNYYNQDFDENISVKSNDTVCFFRE
ncbi:uncharacterized protein TNCV_1591241, partial [Trichonephila clavipes]